MNTNERQNSNRRESDDEQKPVPDESPAEKLDSTSRIVIPIPGAENPESEEIKEEQRPNTE